MARRTWRTLLGLFVSFGLVGAGYGPATASDLPIEGGAGGGAFRDECGADQYLIGVQARTGASIDQIAIKCATVKPDGTISDIKLDPDARGGSGGSQPTARECGGSEIIDAMGLLMGRQPPHDVVRLIIFNCVSTTGDARHNLDVGSAPFFPTIYQQCPDGEAATGIHGRYGSYVDALGLICGPFAKRTPGTGPVIPPPVAMSGCSGLVGDEQAICEQHNVNRAKHPGVPPLTWSKELAKNAQDWVAGCHTSKNANGDEFFCHQNKDYGCGTDANYKFGENLSFWTPELKPAEVVDGWYCENKIYDYDNPQPGGSLMFGCDNNPDKVTGHFTQVVWKSTQQLGCAKNTCALGPNEGTLWACEYYPAGNTAGEFKENVPKPIQGLVAAPDLHFPPLQKTTAIISDVDLYDIPGGVGRVIGILRSGQEYPLIQCRTDDWCQLSEGWVWGAFVVRNHNRPTPDSG